jgi:hypothetical protein
MRDAVPGGGVVSISDGLASHGLLTSPKMREAVVPGDSMAGQLGEAASDSFRGSSMLNKRDAQLERMVNGFTEDRRPAASSAAGDTELLGKQRGTKKDPLQSTPSSSSSISPA